MADRHAGTIVMLRARFGFLESESSKVRLFFSCDEVASDGKLEVGERVTYVLGTNTKGPCARDVRRNIATEEDVDVRSLIKVVPNYMAQAVVAKDNREFDKAERLFLKAIEVAPSHEVILSFAAMEKNRGRKKEAMDVYRVGMQKFRARKIYEDAGSLALSLENFSEARELLTKALELSKPGTQGGIYLLLGRNAYRENTNATLKEAIEYYERAIQTLSPASFPKSDALSLNICRLRTQHHRGNLAYDFFNSNGFKLHDVDFFETVSQGADLIVGITDKELIESFGLGASILVRVFFKMQVALIDIDKLAERIVAASAAYGTDEQFCLTVMSSVSEDLEKVLFARIENKNKLYPAIIPLSQMAIETGRPNVALNEVFGRWLYRRDLFNVNFPVVGRRFFGRNRDLDELRDAISDSIPVGLFGLRKVGKTSLLKELARRAGESGDIYVYIDLLRVPSDVKSFRWIYWKISSELHALVLLNHKVKEIKWRLGGRFESFLDIPEGFPIATAFDADLTSLLKRVQEIPTAHRPKVVLLLDEIERLLPNSRGKEGLAGYFDFFSYLRGVSQEAEHFSLVVTGANAAISEVAQFQGRDNPAFNFFKQVYLRLLPSQECNAMLTVLGRGMGIKFAKGAVPLIVSLTGGHPFFSRQFCSFIAEKNKERPLEITEDVILENVEQYILFCDKDMQEIFERLSRDYPEERDFCLQLAANGDDIEVSPEIASGRFSGTALRHLVGYKLIDLVDGHVRFTMDLLRLWLNRRIGMSK